MIQTRTGYAVLQAARRWWTSKRDEDFEALEKVMAQARMEKDEKPKREKKAKPEPQPEPEEVLEFSEEG